MEIRALKPTIESEWIFPSFIIPKKSKIPGNPGLVRLVSDLQKLNKYIIRKLSQLSKISTVLQELKEFQYAMVLYLNMGY